VSTLKRAWRWLLGFWEANAKQSSTRLIAILLAVTGSAVALAAAYVGVKHPDAAATVAALATVVGAVVVNGCVAMVTRTPACIPGDGRKSDGAAKADDE
jgi:peptidoglycan/LPS O-acetylase OafA/YrhL